MATSGVAVREITTVDKDLSYRCSYCPRRFESELSLSTHIADGHKLLAGGNANNRAIVSTATVPNGANSGLVISPVSLGGAVALARLRNTTYTMPKLQQTTHTVSSVSPAAIPIFLPRQQQQPVMEDDDSEDVKPPMPMNLSLRRDSGAAAANSAVVNPAVAFNAAIHAASAAIFNVTRLGNGNNNSGNLVALHSHSHSPVRPSSSNASSSSSSTHGDHETNNNSIMDHMGDHAANANRKRRKQTHVPDANKDERYWARRLKNNEAAKRSRDMRIKREKVIFEENSRLEEILAEQKAEMDRLSTENKELHLKMDIILEENRRLKAIISGQQQQQQQPHQPQHHAEEQYAGQPQQQPVFLKRCVQISR